LLKKNALFKVRKLSSKKIKFSIVNGVDVVSFLALLRWAHVGGNAGIEEAILFLFLDLKSS
jgi:hypothetical protein